MGVSRRRARDQGYDDDKLAAFSSRVRGSLMSTAAIAPQNEVAAEHYSWLSAGFFRAFGIAALVGIGSVALYPVWRELFDMWSADPLRSIGAAFPFIALAGISAAWRKLGWSRRGSWWGLLPVAISLPLARLTTQSVIQIVLYGHHFGLVHPGLVLFLYASGAVLLFGGWPLLRAAIAPLLLLLFVNPVPLAYSSVVDLPLQELSANTARGFARLIGLHPTGEQLKMMFAPDFGMLIVPGCNGVRGSITFAYLALIFGYSRGLRRRTLALITVSAFLLGYALNLLRLCVLVIYYRIGLSHPAIQENGVGVDYWIGCTIFLLATLTLGVIIRSLEPPRTRTHIPDAPPVATGLRIAAFLLVASLFAIPQLRVLATPAPTKPDAEAAMRLLPADVGEYHLTRAYYERFATGYPALILGDYVAGQGPQASRLTLGLYVAGAIHTLALSRQVQGAQLLSSGAMDTNARGGQSVHLATSFYDDTIAREFNAEASCSPTACADHTAGSPTSTFVLQMPAFKDVVTIPVTRRLPLYLQREAPDTDPTPTPALRAAFETEARHFITQLDIAPLVNTLGSRP